MMRSPDDSPFVRCPFRRLVGPREDWPGWRGPRGDGTSSEQNLPTRWSATENIAWKVELPGVGHASPIVWQDRIFLVSCLPDSGDRVLVSLDRDSGRTLWQQTVLECAARGQARAEQLRLEHARHRRLVRVRHVLQR